MTRRPALGVLAGRAPEGREAVVRSGVGGRREAAETTVRSALPRAPKVRAWDVSAIVMSAGHAKPQPPVSSWWMTAPRDGFAARCGQEAVRMQPVESQARQKGRSQ